MCTSNRSSLQRGVSLIELIMYIVIVSVALAGILLVMNTVTRGSADPLVRKQALAAAYSLLEEIELQDFIAASGVTSCPPNPTPNPVSQANRASAYHIVCDYNGFAPPGGIFPIDDAASASAVLPNYSVSVSAVPETAVWNGIPASSVIQINVMVNAPSGETVTATGYRTAY